MKPLQKNTSQTNRLSRPETSPKPQFSPALKDQRTANKVNTFLTPALHTKEARPDSNYGTYLRGKYGSQRGNLLEERLMTLASPPSEKILIPPSNQKTRTNNKENESPFNWRSLTTEADNRKLNKIAALFVRDKLAHVDQTALLRYWLALATLYETIVERKTFGKLTADIFAEFTCSTLETFLNAFTNYNEVRGRLSLHFKLEWWTLLALLLFCERTSYIDCSGALNVLEASLQALLKNAYYISLIMVKAAKHGCITVNVDCMDEFSKRAQRFNFETGVPLIKTLKLNNDTCFGLLGQW